MNSRDLTDWLDGWLSENFKDVYIVYGDIYVRLPIQTRNEGWIGTLKYRELQIWTYWGYVSLSDPQCFEKIKPALRSSADFVLDWYTNEKGWLSAYVMRDAAGESYERKL